MGVYIGYPRWRKFKKLYLISRDLILTYGIIYFFYAARLELKKQGLSMFAPDKLPVPAYERESYREKYDAYLEAMDSGLARSPAALSDTRISLVIVSSDPGPVMATVGSLDGQTYGNWSLTIVSPEKPSGLLSDAAKGRPSVSILDGVGSLAGISDGAGLVGFLEPGTILSRHCLSELIRAFEEDRDRDIFYFDHDHVEKTGARSDPFFKPDWSRILLYSMNYLSPFFAIRGAVAGGAIREAGFSECFGYGVLLRSLEKTDSVHHIALPLCSAPGDALPTSKCRRQALSSHLKRSGVDAAVEDGTILDTLRLRFPVGERPRVSIIIPTRNNLKILKRCLDSLKKTRYGNYEVIIVDNRAGEAPERDAARLREYYESLPHKIVTYDGNFNFSKMNNLAAESAAGGLLLFLNDDTKVTDPGWLDELVGVILQEGVGAVGPKLVHSDSTIQHGGMAFLRTGAGFHPSMREREHSPGYHGLLNVMRDCSAVTGACLLVKRDVFDEIGRFDERFDVYYGDSDLCLKVIRAGYGVIYTPFARLLHEGSFSIGDTGAPFFAVENHDEFVKKWPRLAGGDPYYHPHLDWDYDLPG